jgi:small subunit ribosomal protein S5
MFSKRDRSNKFSEKKSEYDTEVLEIGRVTKVTSGGKTLRFRAIMVMGNRKGKVGIGAEKGQDVAQAVEKAEKAAKKNLFDVPIVNDTIPHETYAKFGAAEILLRPQRKGRGLVAGGTVRVICQLAGIKDISSKILGATRNKLNNAKATEKALKQLKIKGNKNANPSTKTQDKVEE